MHANDASRMDQNNSKATVANEHLRRAIPVPSEFLSDGLVSGGACEVDSTLVSGERAVVRMRSLLRSLSLVGVAACSHWPAKLHRVEGSLSVRTSGGAKRLPTGDTHEKQSEVFITPLLRFFATSISFSE